MSEVRFHTYCDTYGATAFAPLISVYSLVYADVAEAFVPHIIYIDGVAAFTLHSSIQNTLMMMQNGDVPYFLVGWRRHHVRES